MTDDFCNNMLQYHLTCLKNELTYNFYKSASVLEYCRIAYFDKTIEFNDLLVLFLNKKFEHPQAIPRPVGEGMERGR